MGAHLRANMMYYHIYLYHGNKCNYHCVITQTLQNGQTLGQFFELLYRVISWEWLSIQVAQYKLPPRLLTDAGPHRSQCMCSPYWVAWVSDFFGNGWWAVVLPWFESEPVLDWTRPYFWLDQTRPILIGQRSLGLSMHRLLMVMNSSNCS